MIYQSIARYELNKEAAFSVYSRPRQVHDGDYKIHLVKSDDPLYVPDDFEIWPIYQQAILNAINKFPAASEAAYEAYLKVQKDSEGLKNRNL